MLTLLFRKDLKKFKLDEYATEVFLPIKEDIKNDDEYFLVLSNNAVIKVENTSHLESSSNIIIYDDGETHIINDIPIKYIKICGNASINPLSSFIIPGSTYTTICANDTYNAYEEQNSTEKEKKPVNPVDVILDADYNFRSLLDEYADLKQRMVEIRTELSEYFN